MEIKIQSLHLKNKKNKLSYIWLINVFFEYSYMDFFNKQKKRLTPKQAKLRAESYCAYQERSQQEVRNKLYKWGVYASDVEDIIIDLIEDNFLNEERFAFAYTTGKFKMKGWGKFKIKQGLQAKGVSTPLIKSALNSIDTDDYFEKLAEVLKKKKESLKESDTYILKQKLARFGLYRGFESHLVWDVVEELSQGK